jgi:hypothetical protein
MRVLLLVCVGPTLFLASNSFKAESVTTSPPFVNCSENTITFSVNISIYAFNTLMLDQKSSIMGGQGRDRITVTRVNQSRFYLGGFFFHGATAPVSQSLLIIEASQSHSDTPHSVGLLWTSDQPDAETST